MTVVGLMGAIAAQEDWVLQALCAQVDVGDIFFPEAGASTAAARAVCRECPVQSDCLSYALERNEQHGIWGGLTLRQRRDMGVRQPEKPATQCYRGHDIAEVGTVGNGQCRQCSRDRQRRHWRKKATA